MVKAAKNVMRASFEKHRILEYGVVNRVQRVTIKKKRVQPIVWDAQLDDTVIQLHPRNVMSVVMVSLTKLNFQPNPMIAKIVKLGLNQTIKSQIV